MALLLLNISTAAADPKPLTKEEQAKVDQAIDKGVEFLKKTQQKDGDWFYKMYPDQYLVGQCALPAYALLESGVPADDPVIKKAADYIRKRIAHTRSTYELSLAILFFDRLDDPKDKKLIQGCALRLIAGQRRTGGWSYGCPILDDKDAQDLLHSLEELNKRREGGYKTRDQALQGLEVPSALQELTVFQRANTLPWGEPPLMAPGGAAAMTDNSNTQFAMLGLWAARRHGVSVEPVLEISVERFERFHVFPEGYWMYGMRRDFAGSPSRMSMTCVGLIGLAIGRSLKLPTPGSPARGEKDIHVLRGLAVLSRGIGKPKGNMNKRVELQELYFLWSLERVGMLFNLQDIGGKDWYRWGAEGLVTNQQKKGWWEGSMHQALKKAYGATLNTSFALLFLKRSHPMRDLTAKLPFTPKELNEGIARLHPSEKYPFRPTTASDSKILESTTRSHDP